MKALAAAMISAPGVVLGLAIHIEAFGTEGDAGAFRWTSPLAEAAGPKPDALRSDGILSVTYRDGFLTVYCENTALDEVFERVEASTGITVVFEHQSVRTCRSTAIEDRPLEWALVRFLTDHGLSYFLLLEPDDDIVTVRIFDSAQHVQRAPPSPARGVLRRWQPVPVKPEAR